MGKGKARLPRPKPLWWGGAASLLLLALLAVGCSGIPGGAAAGGLGVNPEGPGHPVEFNPDIVSAQNELGLQLYRLLAAADDGSETGEDGAPQHENVLVSPTSAMLALAMTYNGAQNETSAAMAQALNLDLLDLKTANEGFLALIEALNETADAQGGAELRLANGLWQREGWEFKADFLDANRLYYGAQAQVMDFNDPTSVDAINEWVSQQTAGRITGLLEEIKADDVMFLINALYFKGEWTTPFAAEATHAQPFFTSDDDEIEIDVMHLEADLAYLDGEEFQAVRLPYGEEQRLAMYVFVPAPDKKLADFEQQLTAANWRQWQDEFEEGFGRVALPRFEMSTKNSLVPALQELGMAVAFDPAAADFGGLVDLAGQNLYLSDVVQQTFLRVDEEGSEAAAATSAGVSVTSMPLYDFELRADRPFFIALQDEATGTLLFVGGVHEPHMGE